MNLLDPSDQPYVDVFANALDPSGIAIGSAVAGFYFYNPEALSSTDLSIDFLDSQDEVYFEIDPSSSAILLTDAGYDAYLNGVLSLPRLIRLGLAGAGAPADTTDGDTVIIQYAALAQEGSLYFIDFQDAWLGAPVDRKGRSLSGSNPNQFNYFESSEPLDASGSFFRFVAAASQDGAVGNNVIGTLYICDASGNQIGSEIQGVLSRVNKLQGEIQAVYFYEGTDFPTTLDSYDPAKKLVLLDLEDGIDVSGDVVYRTSSDLPRDLFTELNLDIPSIDVNEGSGYAVFSVRITAGQDLSLALDDGSASGGNSSPTDGTTDYRNDAFQYSLDNGVTWVNYTSSFNATLTGSATKLLVRVALVNDSPYEGTHDFSLKATYTGVGFDALSASGTGTISDDGTGDIVALDSSGNPLIDASGNPILDTEKIKDDDRGLTVTAYGPFNEGSAEISPVALFYVQANPGLELNLELGNTLSLLDKDATISGFTQFQYSVDGGATWTAYSWNGEEGDRPTVPADGRVLVRVNISSECDDPYEGSETFTLTATYGSGDPRKATGIAAIVDNGGGDILAKDSSGNPLFDSSGVPILDQGASKDDDRAELSIPDVNVNEASPYVVFQIYGTGGKTFKLVLSDGAIDYLGTDDDDASRGQQRAVVEKDYQNQLEIYNGSTWEAYSDASGTFVPVGAALLLVRVPLINDTIYEAGHAFTLTATDNNGKSIAGRAIISDFGTGPIFNNSGSENRNARKDDDRTLRVDSPIVNEASDFVVFHVRGITGPVELALQFGNGTGFATLPNPNLEYWTGSAWALYTLGASLDPSGGFSTGTDLYVRVAIGEEQDDERETSERFTLEVSGAGGPSQGIATIRDDGTGDIPAFDASGNLLLDPSGNPLLDQIKTKDDDFDQDGITPTTEDALSTLVASQGIPGAQPGDLNGDGEADALQSGLATLAWQDVDSFNKGNDGTLTDFRPVISLMALEPSGSEVSSSLQLANVRVVDYNNADEFPDVSGVVSIDASGVRTVTLASGGTVTTTWDPIRFELAPQSGESGLSDADVTRAGTQVRMFIDMRASNLDASTFDSYIKYVSQDAIDASGDLFDLAGNQISSAGWYDFNQLTPGGDGARFVLDDGKITGIELTLTDNAFGDDDPTVDRILDPG